MALDGVEVFGSMTRTVALGPGLFLTMFVHLSQAIVGIK